MWTQADREGRMEDNARKLKAQILPWDQCDAEAILESLSPRFITRYEAAGRRFIQINTFSKHQRPHFREIESIIPAPEQSEHNLGSAQAQPRQCSGTTKVVPGPIKAVPSLLERGMDNGEWKGEGKGTDIVHGCERTDSMFKPEEDDFVKFWNTYPKKIAKPAAKLEWERISPNRELSEEIISAVLAHCKTREWEKNGGEFIPRPDKFLRERRWEDGAICEVRDIEGEAGRRLAKELIERQSC